MKYQFKLFILLLSLLSCDYRATESSRLIMQQKCSDYEIRISSIATKFNNQGVAQCSKYANISISDTAYVIYGLGLKAVLAETHQTDPKYFGTLPFDSLNNNYLDISIKNHSHHKLNYDSILSSAILNVFKLKTLAVDSLLNGYELVVKDEETLKKHQDKRLESSIKYKNGIYTVQSCGLLEVAKILDRYSKHFISLKVPNQNRYSIEFVVGNNLEKLNKQLELSGLMLKKTSFRRTFYTVLAKDNPL